MKALLAIMAASLCGLVVGLAQELAPELEPIAKKYRADIAALDAQKESAQDSAAQSYGAALDAAERTVSRAGNVKAVTAIVAERQALKRGSLQPSASNDLPKTLSAARKAYLDSVARTAKEIGSKRATINSNYLRTLAPLELRAGSNPDLAKQVAQEKETLLASGSVGTWHFSNRGEGEFEIVIESDGTCTGRLLTSDKKGQGSWKIESGFIVLYWGNGVKSRLPLAQTGDSRTGDTMLAGSATWISNIKATRIK